MAGAKKRRALHRFLSTSDTQLIMIQETMISARDAISFFLGIRPHWKVSALDAIGMSGGILTARNPSLGNFQAFTTSAGLLVEGHVRGFQEMIRVLNIYGPYRDRRSFWDMVDRSKILLLDNLFVGGDLNLTLGPSEIWGGIASEDPLAIYFKQLFMRVNLVDISLNVLTPTWRNGCTGTDFIAKRLDHFLVSGELIERFGWYKSWVSQEMSSDHLPVNLQVDFHFHKVHYPFKFNRIWIREESFQEAVKHYWSGMTTDHTLSEKENFIHKLSTLKKFVVRWIRLKVKEQSLELIKVEAEIAALLESDHTITFNTVDKDRLLTLQQRKDHLLLQEEITWRLKSRALWIEAGDKNTKFFHSFAC